MGAAYRAHEIDDRHHHQAGGNHLHAEGDGSAAPGGDHAGTGSHHDQQKGPPHLGKQTPPLERRVEKIVRGCHPQHALLLRRGELFFAEGRHLGNPSKRRC